MTIRTLASIALALCIALPSSTFAGSGHEHEMGRPEEPQFDGHGRQIGTDAGPLFDQDGRQIAPGLEAGFEPEAGLEPARQDQFEAAFPPTELEPSQTPRTGEPRSAPAQHARDGRLMVEQPSERPATIDALRHADLAHPETVFGESRRSAGDEHFSLRIDPKEAAAVEMAVRDFEASFTPTGLSRSAPRVGRVMKLPPDPTAPGWRLFFTQYTSGAKTWLGRNQSAILRMGYYAESPTMPFAGNVLYLEGLSDSMRNHDPLFAELSNAGYRVIAFDYFGQGRSSGQMNWTRLESARHPGTEIASIARLAWNIFARKDAASEPVAGKKIVMGWSTGGLAAYQAAQRGDADAVIVIAPAVNGVKLLSLKSLRASLHLKLSDLTHADYRREPNPHVDPIKPSAPSLVPAFVLNLIKTAWRSGSWRISDKIPGLALLSGDSDPLVNGRRTAAALARNAPHFRVVRYADSAHEIHNETRSIREAATREILAFLARFRSAAR